MAKASAKSCCDAFIHGWVQRFGLPTLVQSENGNTFISQMWKQLHRTLGNEVSFTPPYHSQSLGGVERQHLDIKNGLKAALYK